MVMYASSDARCQRNGGTMMQWKCFPLYMWHTLMIFTGGQQTVRWLSENATAYKSRFETGGGL